MLRLRPPKFVSIVSNLSIESPSHPSSHPSVSSSPSLPQRGDSLDPRFILVLQSRVVILVSSLHRIFLKSFFEIIHRLIVNPLPCHQVLKRGIVYAYPIHAFALDHPNSPKHFIRIILVVSTFIDVKDIRSRDSTLVSKSTPSLFFKPRPSICLITLHRFKFPQIVVFFTNSCSPLEYRQELAVQRRDAVAQKGDRGVGGKEGMQSQT
jgi:hypothetical protein